MWFVNAVVNTVLLALAALICKIITRFLNLFSMQYWLVLLVTFFVLSGIKEFIVRDNKEN